MGNACQPFGFDANDGEKAFCAAEMFVSIYNMILGCQIGKLKVIPLSELQLRTGDETTILIFSCIIMVTLNLQGIVGFLLYYLAWNKKIITMCWIWIGLAVLNVSATAVTMFVDHNAFLPIPTWCFIYLLYLIYGIMVNYTFIRWCKQAGIALHFAISPVQGPKPTENAVHSEYPSPTPSHHDKLHRHSHDMNDEDYAEQSKTKEIGHNDHHHSDHAGQHHPHSSPPPLHSGPKQDGQGQLGQVQVHKDQYHGSHSPPLPQFGSGSGSKQVDQTRPNPPPHLEGPVSIEGPFSDESMYSIYQNDHFSSKKSPHHTSTKH